MPFDIPDQPPTFSSVCPAAQLATAYDPDMHQRHVFLTPCNRSACYVCGPRKRWELLKRIKSANPDRFLTLTVWPLHLRQKAEFAHTLESPLEFAEPRPAPPKLKRTPRSRKTLPPIAGEETPREAFDRTRRAVAELFRYLAKTGRKSEYCRILEETKLGYPHYHFLVRGPYLDQAEISGLWSQLAGSPVCDVRKIESDRTAGYVTKYLGKQEKVGFTTRRVSASRKFFPKKHDPDPLPLQGWEIISPDTEVQIAERWLRETALHQLTPQHFVQIDSYAGKEPPELLLEWLSHRQ